MIFNVALLAAFASLVAASGSGQCSTGTQQCCNSVQKASSPAAQKAIQSLVDAVVPIDAIVGLTCSGISVVGVNSGCDETQQPVCCNGDSFNGLVVVGCSPINA